ncbi:hypothetical protein K1719_026545 [Acacia pycnantha]|nr:hypothetical protein K1719_026545 [Acacia pycnantha]
MGIPDSSLLDLIEKLRSWVSWGGCDLQVLLVKSDMLNNSREMCCECNRNLNEMSNKYNCKAVAAGCIGNVCKILIFLIFNLITPVQGNCQFLQDIDNSCISAKNETYSYKSPSESPFRNDFTSSKFGLPIQQGQERILVSQHDGPFDKQTMTVLGKLEQGTEDAYNTSYFSYDLLIFWNQIESSQRSLNFENCGLIWFPPPPDDENDEAEGTFFPYDDEDDDVGDSGALFSSSSLSNVFSAKEKENEGNKEPLKAND